MSITIHILLSAMRAVKKTGLIKGPDTDVDENLRKAREYNRRHPYKEPSDRKATYRTVHVGGYPCLVIRQKHTQPSGKAILFLHGYDDRLLCGTSSVLGRAFYTGGDRNDAASRMGLRVQSPADVSCAGTVQHSWRGKYRRRRDVPWFVHPVYDLMSISNTWGYCRRR